MLKRVCATAPTCRKWARSHLQHSFCGNRPLAHPEVASGATNMVHPVRGGSKRESGEHLLPMPLLARFALID